MSTEKSPPSALQTLISTHQNPSTSHQQEEQRSPNLALQVAHNLRYQHSWTSLRLHTTSSTTSQPLPRAILSGLPPQPLYIHPDEQIELLQKQKATASLSTTGNANGSAPPSTGLRLDSKREWVLPSHLRSKWSLRRFGEIFDVITAVPGDDDGEVLFSDDGDDALSAAAGKPLSGVRSNGVNGGVSEMTIAVKTQGGETGEADWRQLAKTPKRVLLATVDDDSTVVYYIVHDGVVKPRQN